MKILVTGGAGFIGTYLVHRLVNDGHNVVVFDDLSTGEEENFELIKDKIKFIEGNILNNEEIEEVCKGIEVVFHLAAQTSVPFSVENPDIDMEINANGTLNVLNSCLKHKVKKIIFFSSAAVYGDPINFPIKESSPARPISPYGESKLAAEEHCRRASKENAISAIIFRIFNVYGKGSKGVITEFIEKVKENEPLKVFGSGKQTRDFLYIDDLVNASILALKDNAKSSILNIASGVETSLNELTLVLADVSGKNVETENEEPHAGDIQRSWSDISKAKKELGFEPKYSVKEGIKKYGKNE